MFGMVCYLQSNYSKNNIYKDYNFIFIFSKRVDISNSKNTVCLYETGKGNSDSNTTG